MVTKENQPAFTWMTIILLLVLPLGGDAQNLMLQNGNPCHAYTTGNAPLVINGYPGQGPRKTCINPDTGAVGIGFHHSAIPTAFKFSVKGTSYFTDKIGIGGPPATGNVLVKINAVNRQGLVIDHKEGNDYSYAMRTIVNLENTKAFGLTLEKVGSTPYEPFLLMGDGNMKLGAGLIDATSQLKIESSRFNALRVINTSTAPNAAAIRAEVASNDVKAISLVNTVNANAPQEVFRVTGDGRVWMQEARVKLAPFPDYVFAEGYPLMPLDSLADYVTAHHRLPGFPSAQEVAENGGDMGELIRLQQEQLECVVLHLIQLKRELAAIQTTHD